MNVHHNHKKTQEGASLRRENSFFFPIAICLVPWGKQDALKTFATEEKGSRWCFTSPWELVPSSRPAHPGNLSPEYLVLSTATSLSPEYLVRSMAYG